MNAPHNLGRSNRARRAWAQPRFLLGAAALTIAGATWAAFAAPPSAPKKTVAMPHTTKSSANKPASLADLPGMVARYGEMRRLAATSDPKSGRITHNVGTGATGFNLVETDLTPNSPSDEREPVVSPSGDFIVFTSTGADSNGDGTIDSVSNGGFRHIWIMNRNGNRNGNSAGARQLTGFGVDAGRNQTHPTFSPDGNQIAYSDEDSPTLNNAPNPNAGGSELFVISSVDVNPIPSQRTFFGEDLTPKSAPAVVQSPAWSPSGLNIAFVTNFDGRDTTPGSARSLPTRDIFTIAPEGSTGSLLRITGDPTTDPAGNATDDDHPAFSISNTNLLYFSSDRDQNGVLASGRRIWSILADSTGVAQVTDPAQRSNGQTTDADDYPAPSVGTNGQVNEQLSFQTNSFLDNSDQADGARGRDLNIWTLTAALRRAIMQESSGANPARVLTNILSSPANFAASKLTAPQDVDRSSDREPAFSRTTATSRTIASLVFASNRRFAPSTTSNGSTTPANPFGGEGEGGTHDLWTTSTQDTTPPALIPQGVGNLQSPVVAPQPDAPFFAPRTAEAGLRPGLTPTQAELNEVAATPVSPDNTYAKRGGLRFAVVLRDAESGLAEGVATGTPGISSVTVSMFNADSPTFSTAIPIVNENIEVSISPEQKATAAVAGANGQTSFNLNIFDDGPASSGGHEQESAAVAGDGNFYCEGLLPTPATGDYYIDVTATDRIGNSFVYDNVWGISTRRFTRPSLVSDLFVSDYACGQLFPFALGNDARFDNMPPVESYYLSNPPGVTTDKGSKTANGFGQSIPNTFTNVDIWRILCRGPVPRDVLNSYRPTIIKQIDPTDPNPAPVPTATPLPGATPTPAPTAGATPIPTATPLPFTQLTRNVAVARSSIIWATPYAGTSFAGPGTITDPTTQANLASFLNDGGRMFISGRDIAWSLSSAGTVDNSFLNNELAAKYGGDTSFIVADDTGNGFITPRDDVLDGDFKNLQFASRRTRPTGDLNQFNDAGLSNDPFYDPTGGEFRFTYHGPGAYGADAISATSPAGATVLPAYTLGGADSETETVPFTTLGRAMPGATVGQRIQVNRASGVQSRAVYFSFGFESINRRYKVATPADGRVALNIRARVAKNILRYFKTASISGIVINDATNLPVSNFLVRVDGTGGTFFARTDANGNYSILGLPDGDYTVGTFTDTNGLTSPQGFFGGTAIPFRIFGGGTFPDLNLRVIPTVPGAIIGRAVTSNGTFANRADDTPVPNLAVLVVSVQSSPAFTPTGSGKFARLTTTNASGDFSVSNVPAQAELNVIFNPALSDIPAGSGLSYAGPNPNFGRRVLPDIKRPLNAIIVPSGDNFFLNDTGSVTINGTTFTVDAKANPDTAKDERVPVLVPSGPTITGVVSVNGSALGGATVQLFTANADGTATSTQVTNPVQTSGSGGKTGTDGSFSFVDVSAKPRTSTGGGTQYVIRATIARDGLTLVRDVPITLFQGEDLTQNVDFILATLTGRVVQGSNVPVANATVTLQNADGSTFVPARTAKTDASGTYTIANVPVGGYTYNATTKVFTQTSTSGSARYNVSATLGSLSGSSGVFAVRATDTAVTVPTIQLINQQLTGTIQLQVDANTPILNLAGAAVELLNSTGGSFSPQRTTTSGADGSYAFSNVTTGTYEIRASYRGDTITSAPFTATSGASTGPNLLLRLRTVYGTTFDTTHRDSAGNSVQLPGVTVTLSRGTTVVATVTSGAGGSFQFPPVAPGSGYSITATKAPLSGSAQVPALTRSASPAVGVPVFLTRQVVAVANPTSFDKGRTYTFSMPYETSTNATSRNIFDRSRGDATVALSDAFNYGPIGTNAAGATVRFYTVSRFNPNTLAYEAVADNGNLIRGEGYLLKVSDVPAGGEKLRLAMPADNSALQALTVGSASVTQRFLINLVYNTSLAGNGLNGRNLIGFGFDPAKYGAVAWDNSDAVTDPNKASVQVQFGTQRLTIKQAVAAGIIFPSITTIDGATGRSVTSTSVNAFGGYFVTARKEGVKLLFQFPQSTN